MPAVLDPGLADVRTVGRRIRRLREQRGLTIAELAVTVGMHASSLNVLELGGRAALPAPATIGRLAAALGTTWRELLTADAEARS